MRRSCSSCGRRIRLDYEGSVCAACLPIIERQATERIWGTRGYAWLHGLTRVKDASGMTWREVGEKAHIPYLVVKRYAQLRTRTPKDRYERLARVLGVAVEELESERRSDVGKRIFS